MSKNAVKLALAMLVTITVTSCFGGSVVGGLLLTQMLNSEAPTHTWTGRVTSSADGTGVGGVLVQVKAELLGSDDVLHYSDTTDYEGNYTVKFRWHEDVNYGLRVVHNGNELYYHNFGKILDQDQSTDMVVDLP